MFRRWLIGIVAAGTLLRLVFAFTTVGVSYDIESYRVTGEALRESRFAVYRQLHERRTLLNESAPRWPYPPGFFPWIGAVGLIRRVLPLPFAGLIKLPMVVSDAALAVLVAVSLRARLRDDRTALGAAALVAIGPSFFLISGYHGQLDSLAIAPAFAGLLAWERAPPERRGWVAGALIGLGGAIKTVPLVLVLALLPTARSRREAATLLASATLVPLAMLGPFLAAAPAETIKMLYYAGAPGVGGLSLVLQPSLASGWILHRPVVRSGITVFLADAAPFLAVGLILVIGAFLFIRRAAPREGAAMLWLGIYALAPTFFFQYVVWGLPFFLFAGWLAYVGALEAVLIAPTVIAIGLPWADRRVLAVYLPLTILAWGMFALRAAWQAKAIFGGRDAE